MLGNKYFYYAVTRKMITVFGALFNDISISRNTSDGKHTTHRVPLSFANRDKFLARVRQRDSESKGKEQVSVTLPRMSYERISLSYDPDSKLNPLGTTIQNGYLVYNTAPYSMDFDLSVYGRSQEECLQVVEQILPFFNKTLNVSVKGLEGPNSVNDVPFTITAVQTEDSYAGELKSDSRVVVYTLSFGTKTKFLGPIFGKDGQVPGPGYPDDTGDGGGDGSGDGGNDQAYPVIKVADVNFINPCSPQDPYGGYRVMTELPTDSVFDPTKIKGISIVIDPSIDPWTGETLP